MKSLNNYFLIGSLCLILNVTTSAQEKERYISHPDTLRIALPDGQAIDFAFDNIRNVEFEANFITHWQEALNKIQTLLKLESVNEPVRISVINKIFENELKDVVKIDEFNANKKIYMISNNSLQDIAKFNEVVFEIMQIKIKLRLTNLSYLADLKDLNFKKLQEQLAAKKEEVFLDSRKKYYLSTTLKDNLYADIKLSDGGVADFIHLTGGIGVGLLRDKLAPEFSLQTAITINDKHGIRLHKFGVQSTFHYFFDRTTEGNYDMNVNTFLTAFYKRNFSKSTLKDKWAGIGVGYLVKNSGNYFGENTFKVGLLLNAQQSSIDIIPEIIVTDNFNTVFPSLRLGLTF